MPVTIYHIAEAAGVSSSTVARALRPGYVATRRDAAARAEKILKIAEEMGYRPSARGRALSTGETRCVGLIYSNDEYLFEGVNNQIFLGVTRTLHASGYHLAFCPLEDGSSWRHIIDEGRIDGAFIFNVPPNPVQVALQRHGIPLVMLGSDDAKGVSSVIVDDFEGAKIATTHLLDIGHRRIAYWVHDKIGDHCSVERRARGYVSAMKTHGAEPLVLLRQPVERLREALLGKADGRPTALVCYCDFEAQVVQQLLWREGLSSPGDLSVVAFNDKKSLELMTPPITTVGFDAVRMGSLGADIMLRHIHKRRLQQDCGANPVSRFKRERIKIQPALIERESTSAPVHAAARAGASNSRKTASRVPKSHMGRGPMSRADASLLGKASLAPHRE